jgi:hypothetical protein
MTTHTLTPTCIGVDVPEGAHGFELVPDNTYTHWNPDKMDIINVPGDWQILCLESTMTEEQAGMIVGRIRAKKDYEKEFTEYFPDYVKNPEYICTETALQSFATLIESLNLPEGERIILIKK